MPFILSFHAKCIDSLQQTSTIAEQLAQLNNKQPGDRASSPGASKKNATLGVFKSGGPPPTAMATSTLPSAQVARSYSSEHNLELPNLADLPIMSDKIHGGDRSPNPNFPLENLPIEIQDLVWKCAADNAADEFKHLHSDFGRLIFVRLDSSLSSFYMKPIPHDVLHTVRELFWPLFLASKASHEVVSRYFSILRDPQMECRLILNFADEFEVRDNALTKIVRLRKHSDSNSMAQAGPAAPPFPPPGRQAHFNKQPDYLPSTVTVIIPARHLMKMPYNPASPDLLPRLRKLRTILYGRRPRHSRRRHDL
ncbi:hypothetical protein AAE478_006985 [Parahypoxylon ruwenzoriense]